MAAVFFDIDGTLWDRENRIPESTVQAVRQLRRNGHLAFLCSGRTRAMIFGDNLFAVGFDGIVAGCGTYIEYRGERIFMKLLNSDLLERTLEILRRYGLPTLVEGPDALWMDEGIRADAYGEYLMKSVGDRVYGLEDAGEIRGSKMSVIEEGRDYPSAMAALENDYEILQHDGIVAELVPKGFSKATGIQRVCKLLGIRHEDTYAVGDSVNDVDMLRFAEHGIAMGNGTPAAKEAAEYVTDDLWEDGIWKAMAHYGLIR